ncbi:MetQ/NlpA family ABC transporter substrate-binding protein [Macrococcus capreoli]|uniref:MetQ/NlpA family ABC transporter substrate-binding protein n=1 Tax=Macrococcus capreoli TaxID=2982690 RepID=UPI003F41F85B
MKNIVIFILSAIIVVLGSSILLDKGNPFVKGNDSKAAESDKGKVTIGATSGPYADMVKKAIQPGLEKLGYKVELVEYSDYIQPNKALAKGDLDANLYQHQEFTKMFNKENHTNLVPTGQVPTAPMGIYSGKYQSFDEVPDGAEIAIPNDPVNAARAFKTLKLAHLIDIKPGTNELTISERDVINNKKHLKFVSIEAAQLPRSKDSIGLSAVPGNYALASKMALKSALQLEKMDEHYRNRIVVDKKNENSTITKDINKVIQSKEFYKVIDTSFVGFDKP